MPNINIISIVINPTQLGIGDSIINEVCMVNNGTRGDIDLITGFGYQDFVGGTITYLQGYVNQTIGDVLAGEYLCPYGTVQVTQDVINTVKSGKNVKFWATTIPGNSMSKSVIIDTGPVEEYCTQSFYIIDQDGLPLNGVISSPSWETDLNVPLSGSASLYMQKGITQTATAYYGGKSQSETFTSCTIDSVVFIINVPKFCSQTFKIVDINNNPVTDVKIKIDDVAIWSVDSNGEYTHNGLTQGQLYTFSVLQPFTPTAIELYNGNFVACENSIIIQVTKQEEPVIGSILGEITYEIISSIGNDEIKFNIPIINNTLDKMCYYVDLYNKSGTFLERTPKGTATLLLNGNESGILYMNSTLAQFPAWDVTDVQNQDITFNLRAAKTILGTCPFTGYEIVDTKIINIESYIEGTTLNITVNDTSNVIVGNVLISVLYSALLPEQIDHVCESPKEIPIGNSVTFADLRDYYCFGRFPIGSKLKITVTGNDALGKVYSISKDIVLLSITDITIDMADVKTVNNCFIDNPLYPIKSDNPCLITDDQAALLKLGAILLGGVYVLSIVSPLIKGTGNIIERMTK